MSLSSSSNSSSSSFSATETILSSNRNNSQQPQRFSEVICFCRLTTDFVLFPSKVQAFYWILQAFEALAVLCSAQGYVAVISTYTGYFILNLSNQCLQKLRSCFSWFLCCEFCLDCCSLFRNCCRDWSDGGLMVIMQLLLHRLLWFCR